MALSARLVPPRYFRGRNTLWRLAPVGPSMHFAGSLSPMGGGKVKRLGEGGRLMKGLVQGLSQIALEPFMLLLRPPEAFLLRSTDTRSSVIWVVRLVRTWRTVFLCLRACNLAWRDT